MTGPPGARIFMNCSIVGVADFGEAVVWADAGSKTRMHAAISATPSPMRKPTVRLLFMAIPRVRRCGLRAIGPRSKDQNRQPESKFRLESQRLAHAGNLAAVPAFVPRGLDQRIEAIGRESAAFFAQRGVQRRVIRGPRGLEQRRPR